MNNEILISHLPLTVSPRTTPPPHSIFIIFTLTSYYPPRPHLTLVLTLILTMHIVTYTQLNLNLHQTLLAFFSLLSHFSLTLITLAPVCIIYDTNNGAHLEGPGVFHLYRN